jgi:major vault protein
MDLIIIRSSIVNTYLLIKNEGLWEKYLPTQVEKLLNQDPRFFEDKTSPSTTISLPSRDKSKVVAYRVPHNACVQIYDYKSKKARIIFRPKLGQLDLDEQFTILNVSGEKPKIPNKI